MEKFGSVHRAYEHSIDGKCCDISGKEAMNHYKQELLDSLYKLNDFELRERACNYHKNMKTMYTQMNIKEEIRLPVGYIYSLTAKSYNAFVELIKNENT